MILQLKQAVVRTINAIKKMLKQKKKQAIIKLRRNGTVDAREGAALVPSPWFEPLLVCHRLSLTARGGSKRRA